MCNMQEDREEEPQTYWRYRGNKVDLEAHGSGTITGK